MPAARAFNWEPSERWVRGSRDGVTVVDTRGPLLVWEPEHPVPRYAFPAADVRTDLLRKVKRPPPGRHEGATTYYDLVIGGLTVPNAAWRYPRLPDHIAFAWFRHPEVVLDHWYEEDEEIFVHPRDPYRRVDALPSSRHVVVEIGGRTVAETRSPVLLFETGLPTRYYIPPADVRADLLEATATRTRCPYKGVASYWSLRDGDADVPADVAWAYPEPIPAAAAIKDHVAFCNEAVGLVVDGVKQYRPITLFRPDLAG
ncbi:DUF427 domain-containing protein [Nonomuraea rhizosphaerae]|uniref:DUF427 domain-containing protein n=1 Tax=Nonomuraea rhizosphaerae TaxID=2665663 RepID=UPI001C6058E8|nr:DUF427 domain-containing protein [Nonomuraea rhizosphaerae]